MDSAKKMWTSLGVLTLAWALALGGVAALHGCATVKAQVRNLQGCDAEDAKVIVQASADITAAAARARAGGDYVREMLVVIDKLALINERWKHCKATAESAGLEGARGDIPHDTLAELLAGG